VSAAGARRARRSPEEPLTLHWRPFAFRLPSPLATGAGVLLAKRGWLLRLEGSDAPVGWGEAAPVDPNEAPAVAAALAGLGRAVSRSLLEELLPGLPPVLAFALGAALAERDGLVGGAADGWHAAPPSAWLLPAGPAMPGALEALLAGGAAPLTVKWKVAAAADALERRLLERLLERLPADARLRLDANGGWDLATAVAWAGRLVSEPRLEWLEQPLAAGDQEGLDQLARSLPVALDESLRERPRLRRTWRGWQVRRPSQDGDPRPLLAQLRRGTPRLMISTGFETGIAARWTAHLAALQAKGPTPVAPGLAPGWSPDGPLFAADPDRVWAAVA
jgi:O-succinylbenzoate synthase